MRTGRPGQSAAASWATEHEPGTLWARPGSTAAGAFLLVALLSFSQLHIGPFSSFPAVVLALGVLALLAGRWAEVAPRLRRADKALLALVTLVPMSVWWSVQPERTLDSARGVLAATAVGLYMATRFSLIRQVRLVVAVTAITALISVVLLVAWPDLAAIEDARGTRWRGAFETKNVFGRAMSLGAMSAGLMAMLTTGVRRIPYIAAAGLCAVLVAVSWSKFALAVTVAAAIGLVTVAVVRTIAARRDVVGVVVLAALVAMAGLVGFVVADPEVALKTVGRDPTLTGRTDLWGAAIDSAAERPLLGYGYAAFWTGWTGPSREIWMEHPWGPPHAHNGFIDLTLNVGLVGAGLWTASLVITARRALRRLRASHSLTSLWPLMLVGFIASYNLTEVTGPQNHLFWALYVATSFSLIAPRSAPISRSTKLTTDSAAPGRVADRLTSQLR